MKKTSPALFAVLLPSPNNFAKLPPVAVDGLLPSLSAFSGSGGPPAPGLTGTGRTTDSTRPERMKERASAASKSDSGEGSGEGCCCREADFGGELDKARGRVEG